MDASQQSMLNGSAQAPHHQVAGQQQPKTKRLRTSFKHHQLRMLKSYFATNHNPDAKDLKQLSQKTTLSKRVLQVPLNLLTLTLPEAFLASLKYTNTVSYSRSRKARAQ